jgi:hypothetical protein
MVRLKQNQKLQPADYVLLISHISYNDDEGAPFVLRLCFLYINLYKIDESMAQSRA